MLTRRCSEPTDQYLQSFSWNKVKYRIDKPIAELMDSLKKVRDSGTEHMAESDSRTTGNSGHRQRRAWQDPAIQHDEEQSPRRATKTDVCSCTPHSQRFIPDIIHSGNLATRSLASIVDPSALITDSEYLETHLIAVPKAQVREYTKSYESLCSMVVPRSSREIAADSEFSLQAVATFKKTSSEFVHKCREHRWTPRELRPDEMEGGGAAEAAEISRLEREERTLWGEALRLARTGYSEAAMTWVHALALRVFVETVLRYGLPAAFVAGLVRTTPRAAKKVKGTLDATYAYLGGNALGRDSKGRVTRDDAAVQSDMQAAGHADEYTPYVYYEFGMD